MYLANARRFMRRHIVATEKFVKYLGACRPQITRERDDDLIQTVRLGRDVERRAGEAEASFVKQLQEARERASAQCLGMERRLREEAELAQRFSARNTDLQV